MHYFAQYSEPVFEYFFSISLCKVHIDKRNTNSSYGKGYGLIALLGNLDISHNLKLRPILVFVKQSTPFQLYTV